MSGGLRIAGKGRLTPAKTIRFSFDGKTYSALEGDTLASALLANGVHLVGRSYKYHRPRGFLTAGSEEPNALFDIARDSARRQPNVRGPVQEVFDGMKASSQNRWPSLSFDAGAVNDFLSPFFIAGFYYKTFMWPRVAWHKLYEPMISQGCRAWRSAHGGRCRHLCLPLYTLRCSGGRRRYRRADGSPFCGQSRQGRHPL
nr:2Fe-2S iron-sulfur cluster-binding protein [Marinicella sp. W31]MDC2876336.1 2Fe-2S iron-sulfur cluster-binding protein [Marinicella sp. W31]